MAITETIDSIYESIQTQPLSTILMKMLPIALECEDYEGYCVLSCWNHPVCKEKETNRIFINSRIKVLEGEGLSNEEAKSIVANAHEEYLSLRTLEKDKLLMFSVKEMEDVIESYNELYDSTTVPEGLSPTDTIYQSRAVDQSKANILEKLGILKQQYAVLQSYIVSKLTEYRRKGAAMEQKKYAVPLRTSQQEEKKPVIFLSHRSSDKKYGDALEKLIRGLGVKDNQLIYTSHPLHKIPLDKNIYDYLKENIGQETFVIILWSNEYLESPACLNEMGAAWVMQTDYTNLYTPDFAFGNPKYHECAVDPRKMGAVLNGDANCKASMIEFRNKILKLFDLKIDEQAWTYLLDEFIKEITVDKASTPYVDGSTLRFD